MDAALSYLEEARGGGGKCNSNEVWERRLCLAPTTAAVSPRQGIYRVNGVKTRVEKLCQAFENGKELVELSQASPHDISNVLKLYLRQVRPAKAPQAREWNPCSAQRRSEGLKALFWISALSPRP